MDSAQILKTFKIKAAGVKRIHKEYASYKKEEENQIQRIKKLEQEKEIDEPKIKKQNEVLQEIQQMFDNVIQRLTQAKLELEKYMEDNEDQLKDTEDYTNAQANMAEISSFLAQVDQEK